MTSLILEKETVFSPCAGRPAVECDEAKITINAQGEDKENDVIVYKYTVTGGKIIGQGPLVKWDLSGLPIGQYSVTVGVDDGCGICGKTMTKTVDVKAAPDIERINFNKSEVIYWCPFLGKSSSHHCSKEQMSVDVNTEAKNIDENLTFYYVVTGGKIIGSGPSVKWDFQDTLPGTYTITVGVGKDDIILGKTLTRSISERICPVCDPPCECGTLSIFGPTKAAKPGNTVIFRSEVRGGPDVTYKWTVSGGTIITDPTGSSIMVKIPEDWAGGNITATVELGGTNPGCQCPTTASETVGIIK